MISDLLVYVTGSRGLIGRQICKALPSKGVQVATDYSLVDRRLDLETEKLLDYLPTEVSHIVHCAAVIPNRTDVEDNESLQLRNYAIDMNVYQASLTREIPVIYMSGCGLYDRQSGEIQSEDSVLLPRTPYFMSKLIGEQLFYEDKKSTVLRVSAPFGPGMAKTVVLQRFLDQAVSESQISVWGSGRREQDYISVEDIAIAVYRIVVMGKYGIFNIAAGKPTTMLDLAKSISEQIGGEVVFVGKSDPNDFERVRISIERAQRELNWNPQLSLSRWIQRDFFDGHQSSAEEDRNPQ